MTLTFGTDGLRGVVGPELTPELAVTLGRAAARVLGGPFVVGTDTRRSGPLVQAAFAAGAAAEGVDVDLLGTLPTPAVAWISGEERCPAAMISASHNPFPDNGIKLFAPGGAKLSDDVEAAVEAELAAVASRTPTGPSGAALGAIAPRTGATAGYGEHLVASVGPAALTRMRIVLDCAHGAASDLAGEAFRRAGADVTLLNAEPNGCNINDHCGAGHPEGLAAAVVAAGADAGLAFDGDADRCIAVDATGAVVDGDHIIAICALDRHARSCLTGDTVVVTVMTNLGFRRAMAERGIQVVETPVGDRQVLAALDGGGYGLGGEQSGHVIFRDLATTGDGLLTGLQLLDVVARRGVGLSALAAEAMEQLPQVLRNLRLPRSDPGLVAALAADIAAVEAELGESGRVLVRASGTEPLLRVMVEAPTAATADAVATRLVAAAERLTAARPAPA